MLLLYPIHNKSDVFQVFVQFKSLVENQFSSSIKQFQCDGGGEYMSNQFKKFLVTHGILHRVSCPHTPQQNGVAERKHRHIMVMGLSLLAQSHMFLSSIGFLLFLEMFLHFLNSLRKVLIIPCFVPLSVLVFLFYVLTPLIN
jgi:transposase InsO family protein